MNTDRFLVRAQLAISVEPVIGTYVGARDSVHLRGQEEDWLMLQEGTRVLIRRETLQGCTGIKDVNGKLIFEGDKVKGEDGYDTPFIGKIVWEDCEARYLFEYDGGNEWLPLDGYNWEVIDE